MNNRYLLTPYFLDQLVPGLTPLAGPDWTVNNLDWSGRQNEPGSAIPATGGRKERMTALHKAIAGWVNETARRGKRPVSIAGDCVAAIGVLAGLKRAGLDPLLIWFDAHGDFNTWETTPSGFLGGMPLAMLVGRGEQTFVQAVDLTPLPENQVILTDGRDLDPGERLALASSVVQHLPNMSALLRFAWPERPIYLHFDTDVLDPSEAPAQNYLAAGGVSFDELAQVFRAIAGTDRLAAVSVSTWNPALDGDGGSRETCMNLLKILLEG
jgi:arginase